MINKPSATVLMSVYNGETLIDRALQSILAQTMKSYEIIIINDGSKDQTAEKVRNYRNKKIKLINLKENYGISKARNIGLLYARADLIFIMDADDEMAKDRLQKQKAFMDAYPEITISGTYVEKIADSNSQILKYPNSDGDIKARLLAVNGSAMIDPSTCLRRDFVTTNYFLYPGMRTDMDHAAWFNATKNGAIFGICPQTLLKYHRHGNNITSEKSERHDEHIRAKARIRREILQHYYPELTGHECTKICQLMALQTNLTKQDVRQALSAIWKCYKEKTSYYGESKETLAQILKRYEQVAVKALAKE